MPEFLTSRLFIEILFIAYVLTTSIVIVLERRKPASTLAWIFALIFLPVFGLVFYMAFGRRRVVRSRKRRQRKLNPTDETRDMAILDTCPPDIGYPLRGLIQLAINTSAAPLRRSHHVKLLALPAQAYQAMEEAICAAKSQIHLQFYIWRVDQTGQRWVDLLCERAQAGIKVRLLYDDWGSFGTPSRFFAPLIEAGGEVLPFGALRFRLRFRHSQINFRNHRKILTIDKEVGFIGGLNIGDEYSGKMESSNKWNDLQVRLDGDAVLGLEAIFLEDWLLALQGTSNQPNPQESQLAEKLGLFDLYKLTQARSSGPMVQIIPSGPDLPANATISAQFVAAVAAAQTRCWIATPYFIPDEALNLMLRTAAWRGVDVRILVPTPQHNDSRLVSFAGRSYYDELLEAGCRIYEYLPGMLHAKYLIIDEQLASIGSANMDIRSFYLNYEVTAMFYDQALTRELAQVFERNLANSYEVTLASRKHLSMFNRLAEGFARILSPIL